MLRSLSANMSLGVLAEELPWTVTMLIPVMAKSAVFLDTIPDSVDFYLKQVFKLKLGFLIYMIKMIVSRVIKITLVISSLRSGHL